MHQGELNEIIDGVYYQKLSLMLSNLQQWQKRKAEIMVNIYGEHIDRKIKSIEKNEKEVRNQISQFIKILNYQYSFLSKLKKQDKVLQISTNVYKEFAKCGDQFLIIKEALLGLGQFLGKFIGVTNYQFSQMKKVYEQASEIKMRFQSQKAKFIQSYNQKKQLIYYKKNSKKHFQISKLVELMPQIEKQRRLHEQANVRMYNICVKELEFKIKMHKNIIDNLEFISSLYQNGFNKDILGDIKLYFKIKYEQNMLEIKSFKQNEQRIKVLDDPLKQVRQEFYKYFDGFIEEISIANWNVKLSKKHQHIQTEQKMFSTNMFLTFDKKIFFYSQQKREIQLEQTIQDTKIYKSKQQGKFEFKNKKTKEKYYVYFEKIEKQDEFFLHIEQISKSK